MIALGSLVVKGPTDTTTVGLRLQLRHFNVPTTSFILCFPFWSKRDEITAGLVGFYPTFSSVSLVLFLCFFVYQTTLSISHTLPYSLSILACLCSKCTYCPQFPLLPSSLTPEPSPAVPHKDLFTQGKRKNPICVTDDATSIISI